MSETHRNAEELVAAWAKSACESQSVEQVLQAIFSSSESVSDAFWLSFPTDIRSLNQIQCIRLIESQRLLPIQATVVLIGFLRATPKDVEWIHYAVVHHLFSLVRAGVVTARLPLAVHSFLAIEAFPDNGYVQSGPQGGLACGLAQIAPRDALRHGLMAVQMGNNRAMTEASPAARLLGLPTDVSSLAIDQAIVINDAIGRPLDLPGKVMRSCESPRVRRVPCDNQLQVIHTPPQGDASYYIFKNAGEPVSVKPVNLIVVENAVFSIDVSNLGRPQFYTHIDECCLLDLGLGIRPFIADTLIEVDCPLFVVEDMFSGKPNICHFMLDQMPRLLAYLKLIPVEGRVLLCEDQPYYRDALAALGIRNPLVPSGRRFSVKTPTLCLTSNMFRDWDHPANRGSPRTIQSLRAAFGSAAAASKFRRIFISRADASSRRIINHEAVEKLSRSHGFETVVLEQLSFEEQRSLFREASHVIGVHGAGLTNIVFSCPDCRIMEILPPMVASTAYWVLASSTGQRYYAFISDDPEFPRPDYRTWVHDPAYNSRDVTVDLEKFEVALKDFMF